MKNCFLTTTLSQVRHTLCCLNTHLRSDTGPWRALGHVQGVAGEAHEHGLQTAQDRNADVLCSSLKRRHCTVVPRCCYCTRWPVTRSTRAARYTAWRRLAQPHAPDMVERGPQCAHGHGTARASRFKPKPSGAVRRWQQIHGCVIDLLAREARACVPVGMLHTAKSARSHQPFCAVRAHCCQSMASL